MSSELTTAAYLILGMIRFSGTTTPYELKAMAESTVDPFWALPHTQIYTQCDKLVELGMLTEDRQTEGRRRRTLTITDSGLEALDGWLGDSSYVPIESRDLGILKLFFGADPQVLGPVQILEHQKTLAKYEQMERDMPEGMSAGVLGTLQFGLEYERWMVKFWTERMEDDRN
ncbi:MAG TPA: PadR family transcriptional regulator [Aeromicrobium sp.]|nr:PadR family transcriptional regulator [Aeromicrobium sp.]